MAAIVSGNSLGLVNSSRYVLGSQGAVGQATQGRGGDQVYINAATGNLVIQNGDEALVGRGLDLNVLRTYNSQGLLNDDNGDNWRLGVYRKVYNLTGTVNTAGSTVTRVAEDGSESVYTYDTTQGKYVCHDGAGAYDTLAFDSPSQTWTWSWTDGGTHLSERYDATNGGRITQAQDQDGNGLTFTYNASGLITQVSDASGETTFLDYTGTNLTDLRTVNSGGQTTERTRYAYDASNRLITVTTDLSPSDASVADGNVYVVNYSYDGTSKRVATLTQTDGNNLTFSYVQVGSAFKLASTTDAAGKVTGFNYVAGRTDITDPLGLVTSLYADAQGELTQIQSPAVGGVRQSVSYAYNANGDVTQVTDAKGQVTSYGYDANGNRTLERDAAGNTITRVFGANNALLAETSYVVPDPDGAGAGQPATPLTTRYAYDSLGQLRFAISAEGRVTEYRYNSFGQRIASIQYTGSLYDLTGLTPTSTLTEAQLVTYVNAADKTKSERVDSSYDFRGQLATTTSYASVDASGNGVLDSNQSVTRYTYDQAGNLLNTLDGRGSSTSYVYDGLGRLASSTDATGKVTLTQYDDANRKTTLTSANGLATASTYDARGELVSVMQSSAGTSLGTTSYFYDADGRLRRTVDPTGVAGQILYDEAGRKIATIDGNGTLTEYRYDADNNLTRTIEYATAVSAAGLASLSDAQGNPTSVALATIRPAPSAQDRSSWNAYDSANHLVKSVDELGYVTQNFYDGAGRLTDTVKFATAIGTATLGDTPAATNINPATNAQDRLTRNFYDGDGKLRGTLDGEGYLVEYKYDAAGQLVETVGYATATDPTLRTSGTLAQLLQVPVAANNAKDIHSYALYNARGQAVGAVDGEGYLTETVYDAAGNKTQVVRYATKVSYSAGATLGSLRPAGNAQDQVTTDTYTALNQLASETNPEGTLTQYSYDEVGNLTQTAKAVNTADVRGLTAQYDKQGRLTAQLSGNGVAQLVNAATQADIDAVWAAYATHYSYDAAGRKTSATDANGWKTLYYYDADGQLNYAINALGEVTQSVYNALGQLTKTVQYGTRISAATLGTLSGGLVNTTLSSAVAAIANAALDSATTYTYTLRGQVAGATDPLQFATTETYDAFGDVVATSQQIASGQTLDHTYAFDRRGLLTQTVWDPAAIATSQSTMYDAFGRAIQTTDARGNVSTQTFDRLGRVVATVVDPGAGHLNIGTTTTFDAFDRVLTQTDALGNTTTYSYNTANRSVTVTTPEGVVVTTAKNRLGDTQSVTDGLGNTTTYVYDRDGNLTSVSSPAGTTTKFYDKIDLLTRSVDAAGTATVYTYDTAGRALTRTVDPGHLGLVTTYAYDAKGQNVSVTDPDGTVTQTQFDLKGQVTSVTVDPGAGHLNLTTTYAYDGRGKKLTVTEGAGSGNPKVTQYAYDKLGRLLTQRVDPTGVNATTTYTYDKNNNVATKTDADGNVTRYAYDADDRLVYTIDPMGGVAKNEYDADGRVVRTTAYATPLSAAVLAALPAVPAISDLHPQAAPTDEITGHVYDKDGREKYLIRAADASTGYVTQKDYDANGNVIRTIAYAAVIPMSTPLTKAQFDAALVSQQGAAANSVTRTVYDAANRAAYQIDASNYVKQIQYDGDGRVLKTIQYAEPVGVGATPSIADMQIAASSLVPVTATNATDTLYASTTQPYASSSTAQQDTASAATQTVAITDTSQTNSTPPSQPYTYVGTAKTDTTSAATQSVSVTSSGVTNSTAPSQPYTYIASATNDVGSAATQAATLTVQNTSQLQSGIVNNYAWYRSGGTLVTGAGLSLAVGSASAGDSTPTQVRADLYLNGSYYTTVYTDVGSATYEQWIYSPAQYDENGALVSAGGWSQTYVGDEYGYAGYHWYGVNNWAGQVNLSTGSLPAGNYTIVVSTSDGYAATPDAGTGYFDFADGTWSTTNTYNVTVGTVVQPTLVNWAASTQPAGTTASFQFRASGSTGAYSSVAVGTSGTNLQVNLGAIGAGNYDYIIQYKDSYGRVMKSATGTLTTTAGQTGSANATFSYTQITSTATAGSSVSGYIPLAQVSSIDHISTTVTDAGTGAVVSSGVLTYPEFEASYNGNVNLKLGSQLATGRYNVAVTVYNKDGSVVNKPVFLYEVGPQNVYFTQTLSWAASTAISGTTPSFGYRVAGSTGAFTSAPVTTSGANHQVTLDHLAGNYEYQIQYKDSYNRILKSASGTFTVTGSGSASVATTFNYTQITSTASAGSSISGYIALADVPTIDHVSATVTDAATGAVVTSGVVTYPEFEASYNGEVNLKVGAQLANGRYNVAITIYKKDGTSVNQPTFIYEVGPQAPWILDTLSWAASTAPAGTTPSFGYRVAGSSGAFTSVPVTLSGANHRISLDHIPAGNYEYQIQYKDGYNRVLKASSGTFAVTSSGTSTINATFNYTQVTSTAVTGSSISGYITSAEVPTIDYVEAFVRDQSGNLVSDAITRPEFEPGYNGRVNLSVGSVLPDGKYNVSIVLHMKDGTTQARPALYYATAISWVDPGGVAGTTAQFSYALTGSTSYATAPVVSNGASHQVILLNLPLGQYSYVVSYYNGSQLVKQGTGTFVSAADGSTLTQLQFVSTDDRRQIDAFHYDAAGRMDSSTDAGGFTETYAYDADGNKTGFTNKKGASWTYVYDAAGRMTSEISPQVSVTTIDPNTLAPTTTTSSITTAMAYDALGNVVSRTEGAGMLNPDGTSAARTTTYQYDALGRQTKTVFPQVAVYNSSADNLSTNGINGTVAVTETQGVAPETNVTFDALGNATVNRDAAGDYSYKIYDALGRVLYDIDAARYVTQYAYDAFGNQTAVTRYATALNFSAVNGLAARGDGPAAFTASEVANRLAASAQDRTINSAYDLLNRTVQVLQPMALAFDPTAPGGQQTFQARATTTDTYNAFGQVVKQSVLRNPLAGTTEDTYLYYDVRGNKTAQVDALGYLTTWKYDETGDVIQQIEYARALTAGSWNTSGYGALVATTPQSNPGSTIGFDREVDYAYDRKNQKVSETQVNAQFNTATGALTLATTTGNLTTSYGYDAVGNVTSVTDPTGATTYNYYDALGRTVATAAPARFSSSSSGTVAIPPVYQSYSPSANAVSISFAKNNPAGTAVSFQYKAADEQGWRPAVALQLSSDGTTYTGALSGVASSGHYLYQITYTRAGDTTPYATGSGDLNILGPSSTASTTVAAAVDQPSLSFSETSGAGMATQYVDNGEGGYDAQTYWNSTNSIAFSWSSLAALGNGAVRVHVNYTSYLFHADDNGEGGYGSPYIVGTGVAAIHDITYSASDADKGVTFSWGEGIPAANAFYAGIASISSIQVYKVVDGQEIQVFNSSGNIPPASDRLLIRGKTAGLTGINVGGTTLTATSLGAGVYSVSLAGLARGTYSFTPVGTASSIGGTFEVTHSPTATKAGVQEINPLTINRKLEVFNLPSAAATAVLQYRPAGDTGPYLSKTVARAGDGSFTVGYDDIANGNYEYVLTVTDANGAAVNLAALGGAANGTLTGTFTADRGGNLPAVTQGANAQTITPLTVTRYNAFGNVTTTTQYAKGAISADASNYGVPTSDPADQVTRNLYDSHGDLVRSIDPEGASMFRSYDVLGHVAKSWQPVTDIDGVTNNAVQVFQYDKLGHQVATIEPSYHPDAALGQAPAPATWNVASLATYTSDESGSYWYGLNTVNVNYGSIAGWGSGNVTVRMSYVTEAGAATYRDMTVTAASNPTGATFSWFDNGTADGGIQYVTSVQVTAPDSGNQAVYNSTLGYSGGAISIGGVPTGTGVDLRYAPAGQSGWASVPLGNALPGWYAGDVSGLSGSYNFEVLYTLPGDSQPSTHLQGTFTVSGGVVTSLVYGNSSATSYSPPALANFATTQAQYNAFGEITAKGVNGLQEYYDYDNAGHLWRTNQSGAAEVFLYDTQGKATADIQSQQIDLKAQYSTADQVAVLTSSVQRTNTSYDLLERATAQAQQTSFVDHTLDVIPSAASMPAMSLSYGVAQAGGPDGEGGYSPTVINLGWNDISSLGSGDLTVTVNYDDYVWTPIGDDGEGGYVYGWVPQATSQTFTVAASAAPTGTSVTWSGDYFAWVNSVSVTKNDQNGSPVSLFPYIGNSGGAIVMDAPAEVDAHAVLLWKPSGAASWTSSIAASNFGNKIFFDTRGLGAGSYDYEILYIRPDGTQYAHKTGTFMAGAAPGISDTTAPGVASTPVVSTTAQTLDRWGNALSVTDPRGNTTSYLYNYLNEQTQETKPYVDIWGANGADAPATPITRTYYDQAGRSLGTRDANGNMNTVRYDGAGQLVTEYHADGGVVSYQYDAFGRRTRVIDAIGNATDYVYDHDNRVVKEKHPLSEENYRYDQAGNRISVTDAAGAVTKYWFDTRGKVIRTQLPMGQQTFDYYDNRGFKIKELNGNSDGEAWTYDYFGHLTAHTDLGGGSYTYSYDKAGHVLTQTLNRGGNIATQAYTYYENGLVKTITDSAVAGQTYYEYDAAGNRIRERYIKAGVLYQDDHITFDALNRMSTVTDNRETTRFKYDANGNRISIHSDYYGASNTAQQHVDSWYLYDSMNRITLSQGALSGNSIQITPGVGVQLQYDGAGNRRVATTMNASGGLVSESYNYDANGRLTDTNIAGVTTSSRAYDIAGRVTSSVSYSSPGVISERRTNSYNADGQMVEEKVFTGASTTASQTTDYTKYDGVGNVLAYQIAISSGSPYTNYYSYDYAKFDSYKESVVHGSSSYFQPGNTTTSYDFNGNVTGVTDQFAANKARTFVTDGSGQILQKTENGQTQYYFYAGGNPIGTSGALSPADFDYNYTPVSDQYPATTPGSYVVSQGDTLHRIALTVYGDAQLWYLIADANGMSGENQLQVGQQLTIPNKISNIHNDFTTFKVVGSGEIIGDTTPTLPDPPPPPPPAHGGCGGMGLAIMVIVAVVATIFTAGAAAVMMTEGLSLATASLGTVMSAGMAAMAGGGLVAGVEIGVGAAIAGAAIGGAVGSIASQEVGRATGNVDHFSWGQVGVAAIGAGVTSGMGALSSAGAAGQMGLEAGSNSALAVNAAAGNFVTQEVSRATGYQSSFNWRSVAISAIAAPLAKGVSEGIGGETTYTDFGDSYVAKTAFAQMAGDVGTKLTTSLVTGVATQWVRSMVYGGGKVDFSQIAADSFGNLVGQSIASDLAKTGGQQALALNAVPSGNEDSERTALRAMGFKVISGDIPNPTPVDGDTGAYDDANYLVRTGSGGAPSGYKENLGFWDSAKYLAGRAVDGFNESTSSVGGYIGRNLYSFMNEDFASSEVGQTYQSVVDATSREFSRAAEGGVGNTEAAKFLNYMFTERDNYGELVSKATDGFEYLDKTPGLKIAGDVAEFAGSQAPWAVLGAGGTAIRNVAGDILRGLGELDDLSKGERQIINLRSVSADQVNAKFTEQGLEAPYSTAVNPREFTTATDLDFVRVHGPTNQEGVWMVRPSEIEGMSATEIQEHLGLKYAPTQISPVTVSEGADMRVGRVGPQPQWGAPNPQGVQYEVLDISNARFGQPRPLK